MSSVQGADGHHHEIIVVRHGGGDHDDGHHGGVWKIAFADFMTAMMCFFLVMWLINASNEQTKAAVASYFNPVKLIDRNSSRKGLEDIGDGPNASGSESDQPQSPEKTQGTFGQAEAGPEQNRTSADAKEAVDYSDEHLFADPYAVLAEIVADNGEKANVSDKGDGGASDAGAASGASGGESYRDPFAPDFWTQPEDVAEPEDVMLGAPKAAPNVTTEPARRDDVGALIAETEGGGPQVEEVIAVVTPEASAKATQDIKPHTTVDKILAGETTTPEAEAKAAELTGKAPEAAKTAQPDAHETAQAATEPKPESTFNPYAPPKKDEPKTEHGPTEEALEQAKEIKAELGKALGTGDTLEDGISVVATDKGVTISVTEEFDFGMFEIGSAVPQKQLVLAMEKIARVIGEHKGNVVINGHTDARPFKSANYDNWRLSTARAHSAYYMLARAGLDEKRIVEVGGYADRKLKNTDDPFSAANRRIEILLQVGE